VLLKECGDIQLRFGISEGVSKDHAIINVVPQAREFANELRASTKASRNQTV